MRRFSTISVTDIQTVRVCSYNTARKEYRAIRDAFFPGIKKAKISYEQLAKWIGTTCDALLDELHPMRNRFAV